MLGADVLAREREISRDVGSGSDGKRIKSFEVVQLDGGSAEKQLDGGGPRRTCLYLLLDVYK